MNRYMLALLLVPGLMVGGSLPAWAQDDAPPAETTEPAVEESAPDVGTEGEAPAEGGEDQASLVTEGELAQWLVRVLGLARFLPAAPTDLECFQILMQNNISPANGWNSDRTVTMGTLARVVVQGLGRQSEVSNPDDEASWIVFLIELGVDFGTIGEAVENLEPLPQPVGPEAIVTSTDPLGKLQRINPPDNQQIGADLSLGLGVFNQREPRTSPLPPGITPTTPVTEEVLEEVAEQVTDDDDDLPQLTPN